MIRNRSVPCDTVLPHITYQHISEAMAWLAANFGFVEHYRYGVPLSGAQMYLGNAFIMLHGARAGSGSPAQLGHATQMVTIFVDDVDAHYERTRSAGAKIIEELQETIYGERQYGAEDLEGHRWLFSRHARDVNPADWGATVAHPVEVK